MVLPSTWSSYALERGGTEEGQVKSLVRGHSGNANVCDYSLHVPNDIVPPQAFMPMLEFHTKTQLICENRKT